MIGMAKGKASIVGQGKTKWGKGKVEQIRQGKARQNKTRAR
jgi:hypothetical protein